MLKKYSNILNSLKQDWNEGSGSRIDRSSNLTKANAFFLQREHSHTTFSERAI